VTGLTGRSVRWLVRRTAGTEAVRSFIVRTAVLFDIDLLATAYQAIGILNYESPERSGEDHLIGEVLPRTITARSPVLFDVGANRGEMSVALRRSFPAARIFAFEPNPLTYERLVGNVKGLNIDCIRAGLGACEETGLLHCYRGDQTSGHASIYRDMFRLYEGYGIGGAADLTTFEVVIQTIDGTCHALGIDGIDFLKIDVEGHELQVLKGARKMLAGARVSLIQFEFTDCNVLSRTFMRDFYEILQGFSFFRLGPRSLIPLGSYAARLEVFQFQNILAVRNDLLTAPEWQVLRG
jgi:FkbM family methyltransferase